MNHSSVKPALLFFGNDWFAENRTSSHHIARWLAKHYNVYYFECPGLRAPKGGGRDLKKIFSKLWQVFQGARHVGEGVQVRTLLQIPFHRFRLVRWINGLAVRGAIQWLMAREGIKRPITWFHLPHLPFLVGELGERCSVYYCIDDYSAFPGVNVAAVRAMDDATTSKADVVFVASETLQGSKLRLNPNTHISPHGVDYEHFARAQDDRLDAPGDIAHLRGPIVGFFGLIERFVDLELIDFVAERRPHWTLLLIGRVAVPAEQLPHRPNVHFIGKRPYEHLPAYGKRFDVAIIPYRMGQWSFHANPLKLREYLAMGKPIVSVSTPQVEKYSDVVQVAPSHEAFLHELDTALAKPASSHDIRRRMARVAGNTWDSRLNKVLHVVNGRLDPRLQAAP
jgi:glycosyltransferase involved in cell wall biosynthesis